jgi:hypothetical protein
MGFQKWPESPREALRTPFTIHSAPSLAKTMVNAQNREFAVLTSINLVEAKIGPPAVP